MNLLHQEFDLEAEDVVDVTLDHAANVQLLASTNFLAYRQGRAYRYQGGYATQSPYPCRYLTMYRDGRARTRRAFLAFDRDFPSWANGVVIPHGIYDLTRHCGHLNLGLRHDTSAFACDSFRWYWNRIGRRNLWDVNTGREWPREGGKNYSEDKSNQKDREPKSQGGTAFPVGL